MQRGRTTRRAAGEFRSWGCKAPSKSDRCRRSRDACGIKNSKRMEALGDFVPSVPNAIGDRSGMACNPARKMAANAKLVAPMGYVKYKASTSCVAIADAATSRFSELYAPKSRDFAVEDVPGARWMRASQAPREPDLRLLHRTVSLRLPQARADRGFLENEAHKNRLQILLHSLRSRRHLGPLAALLRVLP